MGIFDKLFKKEPEKPEIREHCTACGRKINDVYFDRFDIQTNYGYPMDRRRIIDVIDLERPEYLGLGIIEYFRPIRLTDKDKKSIGCITKHGEIIDNINIIFSKPYLVCKNCGASICIGCAPVSHLSILRQWSGPLHHSWKNYPNCPECGLDKEFLFEYTFCHKGIVPYNKSEIMNYRMLEIKRQISHPEPLWNIKVVTNDEWRYLYNTQDERICDDDIIYKIRMNIGLTKGLVIKEGFTQTDLMEMGTPEDKNKPIL